MTTLPISNPTPVHRETFFSYLARLASAWHTSAPDLAYDLGVPFKALLALDEAALGVLADWARLDSEVLAELLSWTGVRAGNVRMQFRGEIYVSRALRNPVVRGCPVCLREDADGATGSASSAMVMRGHWQMREANLCIEHQHPIVALWEESTPRARFDIGARLHEIEEDIMSGSFERPKQAPSLYDLWLDKRLEDGSDASWLKDHSVFAITTVCRLLGEVLLIEERADAKFFPGHVHATGFDVVLRGQREIRKALDQVVGRATGSFDEPRKTFGKLFARLQDEYKNDRDFDIFRDILRDCILANWPIAAGEEVLGEVTAIRRLHSVRTAEIETGIGTKVLEQFLAEAGAIEADDDRPPNRKLFDAQRHAELLAEIPTLVGPIAMREAMGATRRELVALADAQVLVPRTKVEKVKNPWRIADGLALVDELSADAFRVEEGDETWETLLLACRRRDTDISQLVQAIREKRLNVGQRAGVAGFHGLVLRKNEVDQIMLEPRVDREEYDEDMSSTVPAADFGRSVGLRDGGVFQAMIEAGHVPARRIINPLTARPQYRMGTKDIVAFHKRFVTLTTLSSETGLHRNTLKGILASKGVSPFSDGDQNFGSVYLRDDIEL